MASLRLHRLILGLVALFAVGWAQTFGLHRGWLCDCGGVEEITQVDHCHGPHSEACHEEDEHSTPHQHHEEDGDTHQHAAVVDSLVAKQQGDAGISIAAPVQTVDVLSLWEMLPHLAERIAVSRAKPPPRSWPTHDEWPRRLAQTIALRI